ncbi:involucrin repeat protein [Coccidioides immitis RS]|uniref:Involucrin repeat protein n=2 Tax=Coccidioides immitis TaxID=5501 RepID=A0A0E1RYS9_COCIM|nr:involucrin repeat protein [Coccidioides immitis RS]EAS36210.1 involucrin repeat protein [Coccidioides immitis RS]
MNVTNSRSSQSSYQDPRYFSPSAPVLPPPSPKALVDGYRNVLDSNEDENPRYNPLNYSHPRSSVLLNANDPVAMHLLAEIAITDSMHFEVLSFEEVEELKKELLLLSNRIEASKRKLTLELKLQEAALSLGRLYDSKGGRRDSSDTSPESSPKSHRRRITLFGRHSFQHKSDEEFALSARRCEDVAQELWKLERRANEIRRRILEHTAGVLQMTHKGLKKKGATRVERNGDVVEFDERSLYRTPEYLDDFNVGHTRRDLPTMIAGERNSVSLVALHETKRRLDDLNFRLREMIMQANPNQDIDPLFQGNATGTPADPVIAVQTSLDTLDKGLESMAFQQSNILNGVEGSLSDAEEKLDIFNKRLDGILVTAGSTRPQLTPRTSTFRKTLVEQLDYLGQTIEDVEGRIGNLIEQKTILTTQIQQQRELNCKSDAERDAHIADLTEQIVKLRKELDRSKKEASDMREELTMVMDQLDAARQESMIREQRQSNDSSAVKVEKEARQKAEQALALKESQIADLEEARQAVEQELALKEIEIATLEETRQKLAQELEKAVQDLAAKEGQIVSLEEYRHRAKADLDSAEQDQTVKDGQIADLQISLQQLQSEKDLEIANARETIDDSQQQLRKLQSEYSELESETVRIQTELTVARAELDGAYGSRAERAAQVAANPAIQKEMDELNQRNMSLTEELAALKTQQTSKSNAGSSELQERVQVLEKELRETIDDYEVLTKASIEFEKERDKLENMIDSYRDRCETLEMQLGDERIQALGANGIRRGDGTPTETTSMMVLKNEFKKMMRDTRMENLKALKAEQEERRRLEALVRTLKKEQQAAGKSNVSQSTVAS